MCIRDSIYCALQATGRISEHAMDKFNVDGWNMEMIGAEHSPGCLLYTSRCV